MQVIEFNLDREAKTAYVKWKLSEEEVEGFNVNNYLTFEPKKFETDVVVRATFRALDYPIEMRDYVFSRDRSGKRRKVVEVRSACMYQLRKHTDLTLAKISGLFGFTHASAIHNIKVFQDRLDTKDEKCTLLDREVEYILNDVIV